MHAILFLQTGLKKNGFVPNFGEIFVCLFLLFLFIYLFLFMYFVFFKHAYGPVTSPENQQLKFMCLPKSHESFSCCLADAINFLSNKYKNCS